MMTSSEFSHIQDEILGLSGRELAVKLGVDAAAISKWRKSPEEGGREVPEYIAILLGHLQALHFSQVKVPLSIEEIMQLSALATRRGIGFAELLLTLIREELHRPDTADMHTLLDTASDRLVSVLQQQQTGAPALRVAEDGADTGYRPALREKKQNGA